MKFLNSMLTCVAALVAIAAGSGIVLDKKCDLGPFLFVNEPETRCMEFGMVMECPAHGHGTREEALQKLKGILADRSPELVNSIDVCRSSQLETLEHFAPLLDRVTVNPFALRSSEPPEASSLIWPGTDHPILNHVRLVRRKGGSTPLLAKTDLKGPERFFQRRAAMFEEIRWMVYAAIGANFQGIVWRNAKQDIPFRRRLDGMVSALDRYAGDLGAAELVGWVRADPGQPVSAICSRERLFIVLLNEAYFQFDPGGKSVVAPLTNACQNGHVRIYPPKHVEIVGGQTLFGLPLTLTPKAQCIDVEYSFRGSGQILILEIARKAAACGIEHVGTVDAVGKETKQ